MEIIAIQAHPKVGSGKEDTKKIRNSGLVPAVMYQSGGGDALHFAVSLQDFRPLVYTSKFRMAEVNLDGATYKCILKDIQFHPVNDSVLHIDFLQLVPGKKFKATVPVRFVGTAPGVKEGGKFIPKLRQVNITTTPEKAVDEVTANIAGMDLGSTIRVRDIETQEGVEITNNSAIPIASIEIPRALRSK